MITHWTRYIARVTSSKAARFCLALVVALAAFGAVAAPAGSMAAAGFVAPSTRSSLSEADSALFGMVVRDPFYEYNTDPVNYHEAPNRTALEQQAMELSNAGVRWIRMEFFADYDGTVAPGEINWSKYDWFIKELAPKYNLKVLALLNVGMVAYEGRTVRTIAFNDPPDRGGSDPDDGSNHFMRVFTARSQAIAARYGEEIGAYEIINEPNISWDLWLDSRHGAAEIRPDRYAALLTSAYRAIKNVAPQSQVIVGGIMIGSPPEGQDHDQFDYIYQLYVSPWVDRYRAGGYSNRAGWNVVPWDGVAVHPYFLETPKLFPLLTDIARKLRDRGDLKSKLWITEIGAQAEPSAGPNDPPSAEEVKQAAYLRSVYSGILADNELKSLIAHVFWFKYEDFVPGNYTHNYGLVRLRDTPEGDKYHPSGRVWVHKLAYKVYQELAFGYDPTDPANAEEAQADNHLYFEETRQAIAPEFAAYWQERGGVERFGYPISRPTMLRGIWSQFFERAVFEYHPENEGTENAVLLRLVGVEFTAGKQFEKADAENVPPDKYYFPESGHTLGGAFLIYWRDNGGLPVYGYPISEEIEEISPTDGRTYIVQYFERNRFEYHGESAGTPYEVQLGLLGANMLKTNMWWR